MLYRAYFSDIDILPKGKLETISSGKPPKRFQNIFSKTRKGFLFFIFLAEWILHILTSSINVLRHGEHMGYTPITNMYCYGIRKVCPTSVCHIEVIYTQKFIPWLSPHHSKIMGGYPRDLVLPCAPEKLMVRGVRGKCGVCSQLIITLTRGNP